MIAIVLETLAAVLLAPELFGLAVVLPFCGLVAFRLAAAVSLLVLACSGDGAATVVAHRAGYVDGHRGGHGVVLPRTIAGPASGPGLTLTLLSFNVYDGHPNVSALARIIQTARRDIL